MIPYPGSRAVALTVVGALLAVACASPPGSARDEPGPSRTVRRDDVAVTLALERAATAPGQPAGVLLLIHNLGRDRVLWRGNGCALSSPIDVLPAPGAKPAEPLRRGPLAAVHAAVTGGADDPAGVALRADARDGAPSCAVDHGFSQLEPGATLRLVGAWPATTALDAPAVSGEYVLRAEFPMLRTDVPLVPAAYRGDRDNRPIRVELPLLVAAPDGGSPGLTAAAAVERMLSHPQLALLVAEPAVWRSARLRYRDRAWELTAPLRGGRILLARIADEAFAAPTVAVEKVSAP